MDRIKRVIAAVALGLIVGAFIGCGQMTTAPTASLESNSRVTTTGSAASTGMTTNGLLTPVSSLLSSLIGLLVRTLNIVGSLGGTLTNGLWRLEIPANAIDGSATVAIGVQSATSADCQLEISPVTKNHFAVPVRVIVDCRSVPSSQLATYVIYWFDPATRRWVQVQGSQVDLVAKTVSAPLSHFSRYSVGPAGGKAGW